MPLSRYRLPLALLLVAVCAQELRLGAQRAADAAFEPFWKADSARAALKTVDRIVASSPGFETAYAVLKQGRPYRKERTGEVSLRYTAGVAGILVNNIEVPDTYDPSRKWPVRVQLHGGVNRQQSGTGGTELEGDPSAEGGRGAGTGPPSLGRRQVNRIAGEPQIYVQPSGWADAQWWHASQVENVARTLDQLSRRYNIDESQVYLTGISDGGTGAYYMATRDATRWSAVLPLNGSIIVLNNPALKVDGEVFVNNLVNKPFYIVNGGRDPLYPVSHVQTHIEWFKKLGVVLRFSPQMMAGHDTSWWPYERISYERFVHEHPRDPHPPRLSWETERTDRYNRVHWLVIESLGNASSDAELPDAGYFQHHVPSGRVDIERSGNAFTATSRGVKQFRLLLSPDVVDFGQPVTVTVNGRPAFEGTVTKDVRTLLTWAARDNDRTMLYGAEVLVNVP